MSLSSSQQVAVQNGCVLETSMSQITCTTGITTGSPEKVTDAGNDSKIHKILQYGSRHTIQNTGWTTRLSYDPPSKKNTAAQQKLPLTHKLSLQPAPAKGVAALYSQMPYLSVSQPTVVRIQPSAPVAAATKTGTAVQVVGGADDQTVGLQLPALSTAQSTMTSGSILSTILAQPCMTASPLTSPSASLLNTVLTLPAVDGQTAGKPATVCFIPVSSVICGPVPGSSTDVRMMQNVPSTFALTQAPVSLIGVPTLNLGPQLSATNRNTTAITNLATKPLSSSSVLSAKAMSTWSCNGQASGVRMLTVKVHIDHGHITEVVEVSQKQNEPQGGPGWLAVHLHADVLTSAIVSCASNTGNLCMDHVDANGSQFGYHDLTDGTRVRIARDTSGQRHAPFFLLPKDKDSCTFEEFTLELATSTSAEPQVIPEESDVSEVGTVFTYEPFYVSEQTLVPVHRRKTRPHDSAVGSSEDESHYYYRCYLCSFLSDDHAKVCRHWVNVHLMDLPYRCPYCDRTFFTSTKAQVHVRCQHRNRGLTAVAFQRSSYFVNTLSYQLDETDTDEASDSDDGEEPQVILEQSDQLRTQRSESVFGCHKCHFQTRSAVEMRQHVKFVHGHGHFKLVEPAAVQQLQNSVVRPGGTSTLLQVEIAWCNISEKLIVDGDFCFQCRWCSFQAKKASVMSSHALQHHHWPSAVLCPSCSCSLQLNDDDRSSMSVDCSSCDAKILLAPSSDSSASPEAQVVVYVCNICAFKTQSKNNMCHHVKYNHTKCRPYCCVYCNYVAVERMQVKMHIISHHPDQSIIVKERMEASEQFRYILKNLFTELVSVYTGEAADRFPLKKDGDGAETDSTRPIPSNDVHSPFFTCEECKFETSSLQHLISHQRRFHKSVLAANAAMIPTGKDTATSPTGDSFKCKICGYCCMDRSCMSRHVKYMHLTARPHSCVYCSYNNVEKTKVRLHVMTHHPSRPKTVRTDQKVLDEMSWQAKQFYVRIDSRGLQCCIVQYLENS